MLDFEGKTPAQIAEMVRAGQEKLEAFRQESKERLESLVNNVKRYCDEMGIEPHTLFPKPAKVREPVAMMYRNPVDGKGWSGKGRQPSWMKLKVYGKSEAEATEIMEGLRIKPEAPAAVDPACNF